MEFKFQQIEYLYQILSFEYLSVLLKRKLLSSLDP